MKRATLILNRFITYTPNWWVNGFVLFAFILILDSCLDETSQAGFNKDPRMQVKFKEFSIPAVTVQADSIKSQNLRSSSVADRWLCGTTNNTADPIFGGAKATIFTQIKPGGKISTTGLSNFVLTKATLNLVLDYYVYGDTLNSLSTFSLHEITGNGFDKYNDYFTTSNLSYNPSPISSATFDFRYDSLKKHIKLNQDNISTNNIYDTVTFALSVDTGLAKNLFDTIRQKGLYIKTKKSDGVKDTTVYSSNKTDSVFLKAFKGLTIIPTSGNRIVGFTSRFGTIKATSRITLYYSYTENGVVKNASFFYIFQDPNGLQDISNFTRLEFDRSSTNISGLSQANKYTEFNSPDSYCYLQSGTGLYTKLDFREVLDTIALYDKITFNSAELIIPIEPTTTRHHVKQPSSLSLKIAKENYRLFNPPYIPYNNGGVAQLIPDPLYTSNYHSIINYNDGYLDLNGDDGDRLEIPLSTESGSNAKSYRAFITAYFQRYSRLSGSVNRVNYLAITPSTYWGKSLEGVSFKKDQIKLRIYYSIPK